jgi:phytoene dehydrogenase-like protein
MHNILFVVSHLYSGANHLIQTLNEHPRIEIQNLNLSYDHPSVLEYLFSQGHKLDNAAAIYGDRIYLNKDFSCKAFYGFSKFIYVVRPPKSTLNEMVRRENFDEKAALRYYQYRLRRMYEMARNTPKAVYLTWDDLQKAESLEIIEEYLRLKTPLEFKPYPVFEPEGVATDIVEEAQDTYERHLYQIKQLNLSRAAYPASASV